MKEKSLYIILCLILYFLSGCGERSKEKELQFPSTSSLSEHSYFISTLIFNHFGSAQKFAVDLQKRITSTQVFIDTLKKNMPDQKYVVRLGPFPNAYSAGKTGYYLYREKSFEAYSLIYKHKMIYDPFLDFIYIARSNDKPALFIYNIVSHRSSILWQSKQEKLIELSPSKNQNNYFLVTSADYGYNGTIPFINNARLYLISVKDRTIKELFEFGNGMQLVTNWMSPSLYKIVFNYLDPSTGGSIIENTLVFNSSGSKISEETKRYDILKESYPSIQLGSVESKSEDNNFNLIEETDSVQSHLYLVNHSMNNRFLIYKTTQRLRKAEWSEDNEYVAFSTSNLNPALLRSSSGLDDSSEVVIFSLKRDKILRQWKSAGNKNFFLRGDMIFLDYNSGTKSCIIIHNFRDDKRVCMIKEPGGCGFSYFAHFYNGD